MATSRQGYGFRQGDRVRFLGFGQDDPYSALEPGAEGIVTVVDSTGTVHVRWDSGEHLGMIIDPSADPGDPGDFPPDRIEKIEEDSDVR